MVGLGLDSLVCLVPKSMHINMLLPLNHVSTHDKQKSSVIKSLKEALLPVMHWARLFLQCLSPNSPFAPACDFALSSLSIGGGGEWAMRKHWEEVPTGESCTSRYRCSSVRIQLNTVSSLLPTALTYKRTNLIMFPALMLTLSYVYSNIGLISPKHYKLLITYLLPYLCLSALLENRHTRHSHEVDW